MESQRCDSEIFSKQFGKKSSQLSSKLCSQIFCVFTCWELRKNAVLLKYKWVTSNLNTTGLYYLMQKWVLCSDSGQLTSSLFSLSQILTWDKIMPPPTVLEARKEPWPPWPPQKEHESLFPLHTLAKGGRLLCTLECSETCQAGGDTSAARAFAAITPVVP